MNQSKSYLAHLVAAATLLSSTAGAATLKVASNGIDTGSCGTSAAPCRSISKAIANAAAGDTIEVGPGRYGDIDGDAAFTTPGDEAAEVGSGCNCILHITKSVKVLSSAGAAVTVIHAGGASFIDGVRIDASDVQFGKVNKGFTITGDSGSSFALVVDGTLAGLTGVIVEGNIVVANDHGFEINGVGTKVRYNWAIGNGERGFLSNAGAGHEFLGNVATANGDIGFEAFTPDSTFSKNVAVGNGVNGFAFEAGGTSDRNSVIGNLQDGIFVNAVNMSDPSTLFSHSNIFGNAPGPGGTNCGLNASMLASSTNPTLATGTYWGSPGGPGADPADAVCNDSGFGHVVSATSDATKAYKMSVKPLR